MEQLIELLQQIQELAGVAIDALTEAGAAAEGKGGPAPEGPAPEEGAVPPVEEEKPVE